MTKNHLADSDVSFYLKAAVLGVILGFSVWYFTRGEESQSSTGDSEPTANSDDNRTKFHEDDLIEELADQFGESRDWVEKHKGHSDDKRSIHLNLSREKLLQEARKAVESGQMSRSWYRSYTGEEY